MSQPDVEKKKGKKRRRSARIYISNAHPLPTPEQLAALVDQFPSDEADDDGPTPAHTEARSRTRAMAKPDTGKRDAAAADPMAPSGPRELAFRHPDLREGSTTIAPWVTLRTRQGDNQDGDRDITYVPGQVGLASLATAGAAGVPRPAYNPASRPLDHIARNSATPPNGSHSTADPARPPTPAMKNSELRAEFRRMLFPGSGAR